jgi:hypothetical protein
MIQPLHILRKDIRHLWPEVTLYAVLLISFSLVIPQTWKGAAVSDSLLHTFSTLLLILMPITMLVIIVRLVHDEPLVGDQQFWITRPYARTSLLYAKLLFILLCVILPFAAMQCSLLLSAGLRPSAAASGFLFSLLCFVLAAWLPFTAVAAVTATLSQAYMSIIAALIVWVGFLTIIGTTDGPRMVPPFGFETFSILFGCLLLVILFYQYLVRNTARSRVALVATVFLFLGMFKAYFAFPVDILVRHDYPMSTGTPLHLAFDSSPAGFQSQVTNATVSGGLFAVSLPIHVEGLGESARLHGANVSFTINAPGYHYASPWRPVTVTDRGFSLLIPSDVLNSVRSANVGMHLSFVAQRLLPGMPEVVTVADHFRVPDNGNCILLPDNPDGNLVCRYPFQSPPPTRINGPVNTQSCDNPGASRLGVATIPFSPPGTRVDPIVQEQLQLGGKVCLGTRLTFVVYRSAGNFRLEFDIPVISLNHYLIH